MFYRVLKTFIIIFGVVNFRYRAQDAHSERRGKRNKIRIYRIQRIVGICNHYKLASSSLTNNDYTDLFDISIPVGVQLPVFGKFHLSSPPVCDLGNKNCRNVLNIHSRSINQLLNFILASLGNRSCLTFLDIQSRSINQ